MSYADPEKQQREHNRRHHARDAVKRARWQRAYDARPEVVYLKDARRRAKADDVQCTLTLSEVRALIAPMRCSVTGLPLVRNRVGPGPLSPSLDRIVPTLGYTPENVRLVCHRFNVTRKDADASRDAEFRDRVLAEQITSVSP